MTGQYLEHQYIQIDIVTERYALHIHEISEIIKMQEITVVPNTQSHIKGVINLRGKIVPVISLHERLDMPESPYSKSTRIIVVNYGDEVVGIIADQVHRVIAFEDIQPPPDRLGNLENKCISGIGYDHEGLVNILKLDCVF